MQKVEVSIMEPKKKGKWKKILAGGLAGVGVLGIIAYNLGKGRGNDDEDDEDVVDEDDELTESDEVDEE